MSGTLTYTDTIQRVGHTIINGTKVARHTCTLPLAAPKAMSVSMTKLDSKMYEEHRDICRRDFAAFEDAAYELRDEYIAKQNTE